jgi:hypothetical protein
MLKILQLETINKLNHYYLITNTLIKTKLILIRRYQPPIQTIPFQILLIIITFKTLHIMQIFQTLHIILIIQTLHIMLIIQTFHIQTPTIYHLIKIFIQGPIITIHLIIVQTYQPINSLESRTEIIN